MSSQLISNAKSVLIESDSKNNNERSATTNYGTMNFANESNLSHDKNANIGWIGRATNYVYSAGSGAVGYGFGGLKWAFASTASVGTQVLSANTINQIKRQSSKDKDE